MNIKSFCPFINGTCRDECVFKYSNAKDDIGIIRNCLIAVKLLEIDGRLIDVVSEIHKEIKR